MDYPFFFKKIATVSQDLIDDYLSKITPADYESSPYFTTGYTVGVKNIMTHQAGSDFIQYSVWPLLTPTFPKISQVKWYEVNVIEPGGVLKEHADFESVAFDTFKGDPLDPYAALEVVLCHKVHIHLQGQSTIEFRRSRYDTPVSFNPVVGGIYLFNNYVLHKSMCQTGTDPRMAMTLVVWDEKWQAKRALLKRFGYPHYLAFDGSNSEPSVAARRKNTEAT